MLSLNNITAWIQVGGKGLEEYGVEVDPAHNRVTCWIASRAGQAFSVVFRDIAAHREHSLYSFLQLDGSMVKGTLLLPTDTLRRTVVQNGQTLTPTSLRPFMFSNLELTDEDEYLNRISTHLGEIQICIRRAQWMGTHTFSGHVLRTPDYAKVHERSKKALTHCISYGDEEQMSKRCFSSVRDLDGGIPLVTFVFKYRDAGLLQANGIIPMPPPAKKRPVISEEVLDLTIGGDVKPEPSDEEVEIVDDTAPRWKGIGIPMKRSASNHAARPAKRVKREKKFVPTGEIIDLT